MPAYSITSPETGRTYKVNIDGQPDDEDIDSIWPQLDAYAAQQEANKPLFSIGDTLSGIGTALGGLPETATASFYRLTEGMKRPDQYSPAARQAFDDEQKFTEQVQQEGQARLMRGEASSTGDSFREAAPSLGFSGVTMGASMLGRVVGRPIGAVLGGLVSAPSGPGAVGGAGLGAAIGGTAAGMAASGVAAYRMAGNQFLDLAFQQIGEERVKRGESWGEAEKSQAYQELLPLAQNTGLWEAGPEAIGNAVGLAAGKYVLGLGRKTATELAQSIWKKAGTKVASLAGALATEVGTETVTQVGSAPAQAQSEAFAQNDPNWRQEQGLYAEAGGTMQALADVAPATLAQSVLMMGAGGAVKAGQSLRSNKGKDVTPPPLPTTIPDANLLQQVATRAGNEDSPLVTPVDPANEAEPEFPVIQTDLESMPETGAELVYDVDGSAMGWVPVQSTISNQQSAVSNPVLTPENDPVVAALAAQETARPDGPAASSPLPPLNQPPAAAHAAPLPASTSAAFPGSATTSTPAPAPQPADGIRVTPGANALTAPLAPATPLAPVPAGTSAASALPARPETAPSANRGSAALAVSQGDTMANASQPPIREGAVLTSAVLTGDRIHLDFDATAAKPSREQLAAAFPDAIIEEMASDVTSNTRGVVSYRITARQPDGRHSGTRAKQQYETAFGTLSPVRGQSKVQAAGSLSDRFTAASGATASNLPRVSMSRPAGRSSLDSAPDVVTIPQVQIQRHPDGMVASLRAWLNQAKQGITERLRGLTGERNPVDWSKLSQFKQGESALHHFQAIAALPELYQNSVSVHMEPDKRRDSGVIYDRRYAWANFPDGKRRHVLITSRIYPEPGAAPGVYALETLEVEVRETPLTYMNGRARETQPSFDQGVQSVKTSNSLQSFLAGIKPEHRPRNTTSPAKGRVSPREAAQALDKLRLSAPALAQGVQIVANRDSLQEAAYHPDDWASFTGPNATEAFFDPQTGEVIVFTDNLRRREGETAARAAARAILHERIGHAGLAALRQQSPAFEARWNKLMETVLEDSAVADEIAALHAQGYDHLTDSQLVEEWFARQVEAMTPEQLLALKPTSTLGKLWQWIKDALKHATRSFNRAEWTAREIQEIMALSRQALERGGPMGAEGRVMQSKPINPLHAGDFKRLPNWLKSRLRIPPNAPFRVQNLGLRSILRGSALPADLLPFAQQSQRDIAAVQQTAAQLGNDLNLAIDAYAKRTATTLEAAHSLVATAMENPAVLAALGDPVLKERTRRARNFLDDLSQAVAQHTGGELGKAILQNRGHWMRRSYAAFDPASNWNYDNLEKAAAKGEKINGVDAKKILDDARKHIETALNAQRAANAQRKGLRPGTPTAPATAKEVEAVMRQLTDRNTWERNLLGNMGGSGISKDTTSLMRRADYHADVKQWMKQTNLSEWDYTTIASLAATGGSYQGRPAAALLQAARSHLEARHPKAGKAEITDMLRLKDIPPAIRALMGEEVNPLKRFLNSASFQAQFIARHEQQKAMRDVGLQMGLFSTKQEGVFTEVVGDSRERDGFKIEVRVPTPSGQTVTVPRPIYATPETAAALRTATGVSSNPSDLGGALVNALRFIGSEAKLNKVALNPDSWFVNGIGNFMGLVQSGDLLSLNGWRNVARAIDLHRSGKAKASSMLNAAQEAERDARRQMLARLTAAGVANSGLEISDIEAGLDNRVTQFINAHDAWNTAAGGMRGAILGNGIGRPFGWIGQAIGATTGAIVGTKIGGQRIQAAQKKIAEWTTGNPDRIAKLSSFYGNYESHLAAGMAEQAAFELAAEKTLNTMPDYSQLPALMRELSRLGLMGSFIGFQYEVYRNAFHNARYGVQELRSGNAALAVRGARRLIGLSSMLTLAGFGLSSLIRGVFDSGVDDDEDEAYRRALGAEHERFGNLAYTKLDSDGASFFNTSYLLPQVTLFEVIKAGMEGRDFGESLSNIGKQLTDQFVSGSVHLDPLIAAWTNQRPVGGKVSNEQGARNLAERVAYFLYVTAEPGALNKEDRIVRAIQERGRYGRQFSLEEELKRFLGIRQNTYLHEERIKSRLFRFRDAYDDARSLARTSYRQGDPGAPDALERANARIQQIQADWDQFQIDLETIGVPGNELEQIRKATGVAKTFAPLIMGENGPESERARTLKAYRSDLPDAERDTAPKMMFGKR